MSYQRGQVFSLPFSLPHNIGKPIVPGPPIPPVIVASRYITEDLNVPPDNPLITEDGNQLVKTP